MFALFCTLIPVAFSYYYDPIVLREYGPFGLPDTAAQMSHMTAFSRTQKQNSQNMAMWTGSSDTMVSNGCSPVTCWLCPGTRVPGECLPPSQHGGGVGGAVQAGASSIGGGGMQMGGGMANTVNGQMQGGMPDFMRMAMMMDPEKFSDVFEMDGLPFWAMSMYGGAQSYNPMQAFNYYSQLQGTGIKRMGDGRILFPDTVTEPVLSRARPRTYIQPVVYSNGQVVYYPVAPINPVNDRLRALN